MNFRNIALIAAVASISAVASAQSFELRPGAGVLSYDAGTSTFNVQGPSFTLDLWFINNATARNLNQIYAMVAYAGVASGSATNAIAATSPISINSTSSVMSAPWDANNLSTQKVLRGASTSIGTGGNYTSSNIPYGLYIGAAKTNDNLVAIGESAEVKIASIVFNNALAANDIWGDAASETGVFVAAPRGTGTPGTGASGFLASTAGGGNGFAGSQKYRVAAVPEPGTMAALGLGIAALARRRRNKK
jgi:hypothetical protein